MFEVMLRSISESLAGNGVVEATGLEVTPTATPREVSIDTGDVYFDGTEYSHGTTSTETTSVGDGSDPRWDIVYFDTATTSTGIREGTPSQTPEPPDIQGSEVLLAFLKVVSGFDSTFTRGDDLLNWRANFSNEAETVHFDNASGVYPAENVAAALSQLQYAAQIVSYPVGVGDLDSPFSPAAIASVNAYPFANSDLNNSTVTVSAGSGLDTTNSAIGLGGSATLSLSTGGVTSAMIADGTIVDGDISGSTNISRSKLATELDSSTQTGAYTTSDEELVFVDTSGGAVTITLSSSDASTGNTVRVVDLGSAGSNTITIDSEGSETIDGSTSTTIDTNYGALVLHSDGSDWYSGGGGSSSGGGSGLDRATDFDVSGGRATLGAGNQAIVGFVNLADSETLSIEKAQLLNADGSASSADMTLELVTFDNAGGYTSQTTLITGDGSTVFDDQTGNPLGSYQNTSGSEQTAGVLANNSGGAGEGVFAEAKGVVS